MTYNEMARQIWPNITEDEAGALLWSATCFPFGTPEQVEAQLREKYEQSSGDIGKAIAIAHEETNVAMADFRAREAR